MKVQAKRAFESYFLLLNTIKKQTVTVGNFIQKSNFIPYCPLFFEEYLNPQVRINKVVMNISVLQD